MSDNEWSPRVLSNEGVPVTVLLLGQDGALTYGPDGKPVTTRAKVRFDFNSLAEVEAKFGTYDAWQQELQRTPTRTLRSMLAAAWDVDERDAGRRLIGSEEPKYLEAVMAAMAIANGADPSEAVSTSKQLVDAAKQIVDDASARASKLAKARATEWRESQQLGSEQEAPSQS